MTRRITRLFALLGATACSTAALAATPADQLVMGWNIDSIVSFDPAEVNEVVTAEILRNICRPLVSIPSDKESELTADIAESWIVSDDSRVITFKMRDGLKFASGNPVTAQDVVWSFKRTLTLGLSGVSFLRDFGYNAENFDASFQALDDKTFQLTLTGQYPISLVLHSVVANRAGMILDSKFLAEKVDGDDQANKYLKTNTACYGPYNLRQWQAGEVALLERNENWHGEAPAMRRIVIRHVPESGAQRLLLEQGDIDVARTIVSADIPALEANPDLKLVSFLRPTMQYFAFNAGRAPFDNPKAIEAMRYLIDYKGLEASAMKNLGVQRNVVVPFGNFGALSLKEGRRYDLDLDKAKALLAEAGVPEGAESTLYLTNDPIANLLAQHLAANAEKVGFKFNIERLAFPDLAAKARARQFQVSISNWSANVPDAHGLISRFAYNPDNGPESKATGVPTWRSNWIDETQNAMTTAGLAELDPAKRAEIYHELQRLNATNSPFVYMFQLQQNIAVRKEVTAFPAHAFGVYYGEIRK